MTYSIDKSTKTKHKMCFLLFGKEMYISISNLLPVTYLEKQKERKSLAVSMFTAVGLNLLLIALCKCLGN